MKPIKVKIVGGEIRPYAVSYFQRCLQKMEGKEMVLSLRKPETQRSNDANSYYWFLLKEISNYTGEHQNKLHELFKQMFLSREIIVWGLPVTDKTSTSKLSVKAFYEYCEQIMSFMAEDGFILPSKDDWENM